MPEFVDVLPADQLKSGEMKSVIANGLGIVVARVGDQYYAAANACPHMGGILSRGQLEGTIVTCPRHHSQFDLRDGRNLRWTDWEGPMLTVGKLLRHPRPLRTYAVKVEGTEIFVGHENAPPAAE